MRWPRSSRTSTPAPRHDVIYSDEDKLDLAGARCDPYFKPDWSPEHFLSCMYTCHFMVIRRSCARGGRRVPDGLRGSAGLRPAAADDGADRATVHHIPRILYHWRKLPESTASAGQAKPWALDAGRLALEDYVRRTGVEADVAGRRARGLPRAAPVRGTPLVSLVIPTAGRLRTVGGTASTCSRRPSAASSQKTAYDNYELDPRAERRTRPGLRRPALPDSTLRALEGTRHTHGLRFERLGPFNFSAKHQRRRRRGGRRAPASSSTTTSRSSRPTG